jgi:capsular exopolysaccharide synthesis family protein
LSRKIALSVLTQYLWLWLPAGAVAALLTYAAAGVSPLIAAGALAGSLLSLVGPLWFEGHNRAVASPKELEDAGLTVLAAVGHFEQSPRSAYPSEDGLEASVAYRVLTDRLKDALEGQRIVVVTSPSPEEGKSTTAANIAMNLAKGGDTVVLVDADLRWSSLRSSSTSAASLGLSGLLLNYLHSPQMAVVRTEEPNLYLLPAGDLPSQPDALLSSPRLRDIVVSLREMADYVVIDAPPVLEAADAALLAAAAGAVMLVVRQDRTRLKALDEAITALYRAGLRPIGAVLNHASHSTTAASAGATAGDVEVLDLPMAAEPEPVQVDPVDNAESDEPEQAETAAAPYLRLVQSHERPLLVFDRAALQAHYRSSLDRAEADTGSLEGTIDNLLVDLETTLELIRSMRHKYTAEEGCNAKRDHALV